MCCRHLAGCLPHAECVICVCRKRKKKERVREETMRERREREGRREEWLMCQPLRCRCFLLCFVFLLVFPGGSDGKESCSVGDRGSVPGLGRSPGEGNGYPLQYSCLKNPITICGAMSPHPLIDYILPSLPQIFTSWGWGCFFTLWTVLDLWWWLSH